MSTEDLIVRITQIVALLNEKKANNILAFQATDPDSLVDGIVVAEGTSTTHLRALSDIVSEELKKSGMPLVGIEGKMHGEWVILDYGWIMVHIFLPEYRERYKIEELWAKANAVELVLN